MKNTSEFQYFSISKHNQYLTNWKDYTHKNKKLNDLNINLNIKHSIFNYIKRNNLDLNFINFPDGFKLYLAKYMKYSVKLLEKGFVINFPINILSERLPFKNKILKIFGKNKKFVHFNECCLLQNLNNELIENKIIPKMEIQEDSIRLAFFSFNFIKFKNVIERFYNGNLEKITNYIIENEIIMKLSKNGKEQFLIKIFENYIIPNEKVFIF